MAFNDLRISMVDVYVLRRRAQGLLALVLRREAGRRSPGSWECVHGHVDEGETAVQAAMRELAEETGYTPERLYNLSRVEMFYSHRTDGVLLIPAFAAFVDGEAEPVLSAEHDRAEWLPVAEAMERVSWPRLARGLGDVGRLLAGGSAGPVEDVLVVESRVP